MSPIPATPGAALRTSTSVHTAPDGTVTTTVTTTRADGSSTTRTTISRPGPAWHAPAAQQPGGVLPGGVPHVAAAAAAASLPPAAAKRRASVPDKLGAALPPHDAPTTVRDQRKANVSLHPQPVLPQTTTVTTSTSAHGSKISKTTTTTTTTTTTATPTHGKPAVIAAKPAKPAEPAPALADPESAFEIECLDGHNRLRRIAGVQPLAWSPDLAAAAKRWAEHLAAAGALEHSQGRVGHFGENLYMVVSSVPLGHRHSHLIHGLETKAQRESRLCNAALDAFFDERHKYGGEPIDRTNYHACGHYTQLVWPSTTMVGAAIASAGHNTVVVCEYWPPGNVLGQCAPAVRD
nr:hypothetical protein HK105_001969 [Polyrhizophydium stewartii]